MSAQQADVNPAPTAPNAQYDYDSLGSKTTHEVEIPPESDVAAAQTLMAQENQRMEAALGDAILRFLRIRKGRDKETQDLDAVRTCLM